MSANWICELADGQWHWACNLCEPNRKGKRPGGNAKDEPSAIAAWQVHSQATKHLNTLATIADGIPRIKSGLRCGMAVGWSGEYGVLWCRSVRGHAGPCDSARTTIARLDAAGSEAS